MPADDVSDLRDVVDAINRLCDTMKTSHYDDVCDDSPRSQSPEAAVATEWTAGDVPTDEAFSQPEATLLRTEDTTFSQPEYVAVACRPLATEWTARDTQPEYVALSQCENVALSQPEDVALSQTEDVAFSRPPEEVSDLATEILGCLDVASPESLQPIDAQERWSDSLCSLPVETVTSDAEPAAHCEPPSEMYYTASSEVSLLSDTEVPERPAADDDSPDERRDDRKECVMAGHVAAMRERFESMTRTNTPCPDLARSASPSLDVFRNVTPSPDRLG